VVGGPWWISWISWMQGGSLLLKLVGLKRGFSGWGDREDGRLVQVFNIMGDIDDNMGVGMLAIDCLRSLCVDAQ
jgi:hypothetical protein